MMKSLNVYRDHGVVAQSVITQVEVEMGHCFPSAYKELISKHNALRPEEDLFSFTNHCGHPDTRDISFFGYGEWPIDDLRAAQHSDIYGHRQIVAFAGCANGDYICFDYRHDPRTCEPRIVLMLHDEYIEDVEGNPKMVIIDVAPNFEAFIDMLYRREDDE